MNSSEISEKLNTFRFKPADPIIGPLYAVGYYDACKHAANMIEENSDDADTLDAIRMICETTINVYADDDRPHQKGRVRMCKLFLGIIGAAKSDS